VAHLFARPGARAAAGRLLPGRAGQRRWAMATDRRRRRQSAADGPFVPLEIRALVDDDEVLSHLIERAQQTFHIPRRPAVGWTLVRLNREREADGTVAQQPRRILPVPTSCSASPNVWLTVVYQRSPLSEAQILDPPHAHPLGGATTASLRSKRVCIPLQHGTATVTRPTSVRPADTSPGRMPRYRTARSHGRHQAAAITGGERC